MGGYDSDGEDVVIAVVMTVCWWSGGCGGCVQPALMVMAVVC